jgi:hypothetical protein
LQRQYDQRPHWQGHDHFNVAGFFRASQRLDSQLVQRVLAVLIARHDALRALVAAAGGRHYYVLPPPSASIPFTAIDLSQIDDEGIGQSIIAVSANLQDQMNLIHGPSLQLALFDLGPSRPQRLLLLVSHSFCDGYSVDLLIKEFATIYSQLARKEEVVLPEISTTWYQYLQRRNIYALSTDFQVELKRWRAIPWSTAPFLPIERPVPRAANTMASMKVLRVSLSVEESRELVCGIRKHGITVLDVFLTALACSLTWWAGYRRHVIHYQHNGRVSPFIGENLVQTVGDIRRTVPAFVEIRPDFGPAELLALVHQQINATPYHGMMRDWLPPGLMRSMDVNVNYLGQWQTKNRDQALLQACSEPVGPIHGLELPRAALLEFGLAIIDHQLWVECSYSQRLYTQVTVTRLINRFMENLRTLIAIF